MDDALAVTDDKAMAFGAEGQREHVLAHRARVVAEGAPALVAVGQVGPGNALTMVLSDGRRIALTVRDGLAYAVVPFDLSSGPTDAPVAAWEVTTGGKTTMTTQSPWGVGVQYGSIPAECAPPPLPLPAPGEQPTDADAARAAATVAVTTVFTGNTDEPARLGFIDDPHGLADVRDALLSGGFASQVRNATVEVGDMVFTARDRAAVRLTIVAVARFDLIGEARLIDGTWKVTRASYCDAATLAGVHCPD